MTSPIYPLDLPRVKAYLSIQAEDTSQDAFLTDSIEACSDQLDRWLPHSIIERDAETSADVVPALYDITVRIPLRGPVLSIRDVLSQDGQGRTVTVPADGWARAGDGVLVREVPRDSVRITVRYRIGADVPPIIHSALLTMVRSRAERRDEDPMTPAVMAMISPFLEPHI